MLIISFLLEEVDLNSNLHITFVSSLSKKKKLTGNDEVSGTPLIAYPSDGNV